MTSNLLLGFLIFYVVFTAPGIIGLLLATYFDASKLVIYGFIIGISGGMFYLLIMLGIYLI